MRTIRLGDADAIPSTVVDDAANGMPSIIARGGEPEVVVVSFAEWERLSTVPSFGRLLMASGLEEGDLPERNRKGLRTAGF
ncbi:type II toxin-antitoxin system prevent-host-death family antitoxin [Mangrovicella endophytica]|uniref:type II toxin-antitoxin system prevent-host-death family antitoxin n=1 Tax=Mangrovicella endophytica TaxID=2066697 RepID=UPI000C9E9AE3|nr:type II toxin-antitoxin system prevent-host-death family antitoxin [Mangrovicella endophytica]